MGMDEEPIKRLFVRTEKKKSKGDITVGVCYRPIDQEEQVDEDR